MYSIYYRNVLQEISGDLRGEEKGTFLPESESERRRCQNGRSPQPWKKGILQPHTIKFKHFRVQLQVNQKMEQESVRFYPN